MALRGADLAPISEYEGRRIASVRFDPAKQPVMAAELARIVPFRSGEALHLADVDETIRRLFATGNYSNIEVAADPAPGGLAVVIRTTPQWFVGPVEVRGRIDTPPTPGHIVNATRLDLGTPYEDSQLHAAVENIRDLLEHNGLFHGSVTPAVVRDPAHQQVAITFRVDTGRHARLTLPLVTGDTRIPPGRLEQAAGYRGWFRWKRATSDNVQSGLQNMRKLYDKQDRLTASVTLTREDYLAQFNRVRPVVEADGGPRIKIVTEGAHVSRSNLRKYVPIYDLEAVNRDLLVMGATNLRAYFQGQGYFDAQVDFTVHDVNPDLRTITFTISLGQRHRVVKVTIRGNRYFSTSDIHDRLLIHAAGFLYLRHGRYSDADAKLDKAAIERLYQENGFQDVQVTIAAQDNYLGKTGDVAVTVDIHEGPQSLVSALNVEGLDRPDRATILALLASQPGQPFSMQSVAVDRNYILELYQAAGYPNVSFDYSARPAPEAHRMEVTYKVVPGQPRFVRDVLISGLRTTSYRLVRREIPLHTGDPLSWSAMGRAQRRLYNLGVFAKVDMAVQNEQGETENKFVLYHMVEGPRYAMTVGFGAEIARIGGSQSSLDNPQGTTGFAPRGTFAISRLNLWGLGHSVTFRTVASTIYQRASITYLYPNLGGVTGRDLTFTARYDNVRDVLTYTGRSIEGAVQLSQRHSKATTFLWRYYWRDVRVNSANLKIDPLLIPLASQPAQVAGIAWSMIQDHRDNALDAHHGYYNSVDLGLNDHFFGGNKNFMRLLGRSSWYKPVTRTWTFATNTSFGMIQPFGVPHDVDSLNYIPIPERFFAGGISTNRGFPFDQAGPRDLVTGFPLGGNALLFHQDEIRFPFLIPSLGAVLFHDMGNVYRRVQDISFRVQQRNIEDFDYMVHAVGVGFRYKTPVGPVSVDLAYSINPPTFFGLQGTFQQLLFGGATSTIQSINHFQFFITIGQAF